jgi:hypothetical protein
MRRPVDDLADERREQARQSEVTAPPRTTHTAVIAHHRRSRQLHQSRSELPRLTRRDVRISGEVDNRLADVHGRPSSPMLPSQP